MHTFYYTFLEFQCSCTETEVAGKSLNNLVLYSLRFFLEDNFERIKDY